jgi:hypothetical protein
MLGRAYFERSLTGWKLIEIELNDKSADETVPR